MPDRKTQIRRRAYFIGLGTRDFNIDSKDEATQYFDLFDLATDKKSDGIPESLRLLSTGDFAWAPFIFSLSTDSVLTSKVEEYAIEAHRLFPQSYFYFVYPSGHDAKWAEELIDRINWPGPPHFIGSIESFNQLLRSVKDWSVPVRPPGYSKKPEDESVENDQISITFDASITEEQIGATLLALADYYRACGGVGLPANFETQHALELEDTHV